MVSKLEKAINNLYFCYAPIVAIALLISIKLTLLTPIKCLLNSSAKDCIFYSFNFNFVYHPISIINLIFIIYNILYIYYNVILKQDVVGKTVRKIYSKTRKAYRIKSDRKKANILLFCYISALLLSYFRFPITLYRII